MFASEIKAIITDPSVQPRSTRRCSTAFLTYFYVPGPQTLFRNIHRLEPGHYLTVKNGQVKVTQYWDLTFNKVSRSFAYFGGWCLRYGYAWLWQ